MTEDKNKYKTIRAIERGLNIIRILNQKGGITTIKFLSEESQLHQATVRRILETLTNEGYVASNDLDPNRFELTPKIKDLSQAFSNQIP